MKPHNVTSILLQGPKDAPKSSFLMQGAFHYAEQGHTVIYITSNELSSLPSPIEGLPRPSPDVFSLIKFLYLPSWQDLLQHLFSLHIHTLIPSVIIVESLEQYCTEPSHLSDFSSHASQASHAALICAALLDGAAVCAKRCKGQVQLFVSLNQQHSEKTFSPLLDIFFPEMVWSFEKSKTEDLDGNAEEYVMIKLASSRENQYKIYFRCQSHDGPVVLSKMAFWKSIDQLP